MLRGIYNFFARKSELYQRVERERGSLSDQLAETEKDIEDLELSLGIEKEKTKYLYDKTQTLTERLRGSIHQSFLKNLSQLPFSFEVLHLSSYDGTVLNINQEALKVFKTHTGNNFNLTEEELEYLRTTVKYKTKPFIVKFKQSRLNDYFVIPTENGLGETTGYLISNQRKALQRLRKKIREGLETLMEFGSDEITNLDLGFLPAK